MKVPYRKFFLTVLLVAGCATSDRPLQLVAGAAAVYPLAARSAGVEGFVEVAYGVDVEGNVLNPRVVRSEPEGTFDRAALDAVSRWQFKAPVLAGKVQAVEEITSTLRFKLSGSERYAEFER